MITSMLRRAMLSGDGSALSLDFTQMSTLADLTSRGLTFSRSTSGTYLNANGLVATATAGNPRFDYDTSGNPRGILIEGSATNLVYHSETFRLTAVAAEPYWADSASVSRGNDTAPDGTAGAAVNIIAIGTAGTVIQTAAVGSSANRTFSFWAKRSGGGTIEYTLDNGSTWTAVTITANWVRYTATATNANQRVGFRVATGSGTSIWGAMLEAGSGSSSYIPSGASQGSRDQDLVSVTLTNFSSWWTSNNPASFLLDFSSTQRPSTNRIIRIADSGGSAFGYSVYFNSSTMPQQVRAVLSSASSSDISIGTNLAANTRTKVGFTIETAALKRFRDGSLASTLSSPSLPPNTMTQMYIGGNPAFGNSSADFCLRSFKYWPTTLADATMQILTT